MSIPKTILILLLIWLVKTFNSEGEAIQFLSTLKVDQACSAKVTHRNAPEFGDITHEEWKVIYMEMDDITQDALKGVRNEED